jgi:hypothetical protein
MMMMMQVLIGRCVTAGAQGAAAYVPLSQSCWLQVFSASTSRGRTSDTMGQANLTLTTAAGT